jgi:hypothetical protein
MRLRNLGLVLVVLLMMVLSGCAASAAEWPDRAVDVNIDAERREHAD